MPFPVITNLTGANPGPNSATVPDTVQMPTGNMWKVGDFSLQITPTACATGPSVNVQTFPASGIGLLVGDLVQVSYQGTQTATVAVLDARVYQNDGLEIKFLATAGTPTPAAGTVALPYLVSVFRTQPNWTKPAAGSQLGW